MSDLVVEENLISKTPEQMVRSAKGAIEQTGGENEIIAVIRKTDGFKVVGTATEAVLNGPDEKSYVTANFRNEGVVISSTVPKKDSGGGEVRLLTWKRSEPGIRPK